MYINTQTGDVVCIGQTENAKENKLRHVDMTAEHEEKHINKNKTVKGNNSGSHNSWEYSISYDKDNLSANLPLSLSLSRSRSGITSNPLKWAPS